ncbi:mxaJ protein [Methylophilaceae bacterium]|nr:mxaJ protein [Methylophilaceae bacterium]
MLRKLKHFSMLLIMFGFIVPAHADEGAAPNELNVNMDIGRGGEPRRVEDPTEFKACAEADNLPFSNSKQEGFENKIAELIAKDLNKTLSYQFWHHRLGYYRNTLNANRCDVVIGTVAFNDMLLTTKPYYRSTYVFVYRKDSGYNITDWDSPDLKKAKAIGVIDKTPVASVLDDKGLMENARPYRIFRDLTLPPSFVIDDLVKGDIDVAILWGPIAGYYAKKASVPLVVVPAPEYEGMPETGKLQFNISMGMRKKDKERQAIIQEVLDRRQADILKILDEYGVPYLPVVDERKAKVRARGDVIPKNE